MFQYVVTNLMPLVRHDSMEGRDWLVAPTQMITEGVHNGSDGPILYPAEELAKIPVVWNHKPIVVYHPQQNGRPISACSPVELTTRKIGVLMNTQFNGDSKKLAAEAWLDPVRIGVVDNRINDAITKNEMMEVSTGVFMDLDRTPGVWNGKEYIGVARNLQPDHLAVLPDLKGACSIIDGAGLLRANQAVNSLSVKIMNEMSFDSVQTLLRGALLAKEDNAWINDVFDDYFIYEKDGRLYKQVYKIDNGQAQFEGLPINVERQVTYKLVGLLTNNNKVGMKKGNVMDKEKMVDELISNEKTSWTEDHRKALTELPDEVLVNMHKDIAELCKSIDNKPLEKPVIKPVEKKEDVPAANVLAVVTKPQTLAEYIQNAPPEWREKLEDDLFVMNETKSKLIDVIMANERNVFTKEHLTSKHIRELQALAKLAEPVVQMQNVIPLYFGQTPVHSSFGKVEPLGLPTMNFEKAAG